MSREESEPGPARRHLRLRLRGLHCDGCATNIETVLARAAGVREVEVSYEEEEGRVRYDPEETGPQDLLDLDVFTLGEYRAEILEDRET